MLIMMTALDCALTACNSMTLDIPYWQIAVMLIIPFLGLFEMFVVIAKEIKRLIRR